MKGVKRITSKNQLIDWVNFSLKADGISITKIQQLGSGVVYLLLLNQIHPGALTGVKFIKKPTNQYEYQLNLKVLTTAFAKLGINKNVDIQKLSKMKMQDNINFLQWFYNYSQSITSCIGEVQPMKKMKIKAPQKLKLTTQDRFSKIDTEYFQQMQLKIVTSASKKINLIDQIIHNENLSNDEIKIIKIMDILNLKIKQVNLLTNTEQIDEELLKDQQNFINQQTNYHSDDKQNKQLAYVNCQRLQQKYDEYSKNCIEKNQNEKLRYSQIKRESKKQNTQLLQHDSAQLNQMILTDNSILLQSDKKSIHSQNLLNDQ